MMHMATEECPTMENFLLAQASDRSDRECQNRPPDIQISRLAIFVD